MKQARGEARWLSVLWLALPRLARCQDADMSVTAAIRPFWDARTKQSIHGKIAFGID